MLHCLLQFTEGVVNLKFDEEPQYEAFMKLFEPLCGPSQSRPVIISDPPKVCRMTYYSMLRTDEGQGAHSSLNRAQYVYPTSSSVSSVLYSILSSSRSWFQVYSVV
jgi:hypothetical protein